MTTEWLQRSDVAAALTAALFKHSFSNLPGSMGMVAAKAATYSILARVLPTKVAVSVGTMTNAQRSEILVALLGAAGAAWKNENMLQGAVAYSAIDALSLQVMQVLGIAEGSLLGA